MGFLSNFAAATGQAMLAGQQYEQGQAELEYRQQAVALQKMQLLAARQKMDTDKAIGAELAAGFAGDKAAVDDPLKAATLYSNAARTAASRGDLDGMRQYEQLAQSEVTRAKTAQATKAAEQKERLDGLANAASDFRANPSPQAAAAVVRNALAAGVPMKDIPDMRAPEFPAWVKRQEQSGMSAKERLSLEEKQREFDERQADRKEQHERDRQDRLQRERDRQALQQQGLQLRRMLADSLIAQRDAKAGGKVEAVGKVEMNHRSQAIEAGAQATRQIEQLALGFRPGDTLGPFAALKPGSDISASLAQLGTTTLTKPAAQAMQAVTANLAKNIGNLLTAVEGGRSPTDSQIKSMQAALSPQAGENVLVSAFKIKNAAEESATALTSAKHSDPEKEAKRQKTLAALDNIMPGVSAMDLLKAIRDSKNPQLQAQLARAQQTYSDAVGSLGVGEPQAPTAPPRGPKPGVISVDDWLK